MAVCGFDLAQMQTKTTAADLWLADDAAPVPIQSITSSTLAEAFPKDAKTSAR